MNKAVNDEVRRTLQEYNQLVRSGSTAEINSFLVRHAHDKKLAVAIKVQEAVRAGFADAAKDLADVVRRVASSPG